MISTGQSKAKASDGVKFFARNSFAHWGVPLDKDYRKQWVQARFNELRGERRLGFAEIARRVGLSKQYVHQVSEGGNPSEKPINGLCSAFGFEPPALPGMRQVTSTVKSPSTMGPSSNPAHTRTQDMDIAELAAKVESMQQTMEGIAAALLRIEGKLRK